MSNIYLRSFVIGSCCFVFFPFYYCVYNFKKNKSNIDYVKYTFIAPLFLGLMNIFSLIIQKHFNLSFDFRFILISLITPTLVAIFIIYLKMYNYTIIEWINHIIILYIFYFFICNIIIKKLEMYV